MRKFFIYIAWIVALPGVMEAQERSDRRTLSGTIKEAGSGELLPGVSIYTEDRQRGASSNAYGFFSLTLPPGVYTIYFSYIGYTTLKLEVDLSSGDQRQAIEMLPSETKLEGVEVIVERLERISESSQMSVVSVPAKQIQQIPALFGERDVMKVLQLMPGVQSGGEGTSGLYVRGGGPDQNLIILDDAIVYNANHLFGFFSLFNGDAIKNVNLYKGGFPARFGGRLSSVVEMDMKDGHKEEYHGKIGVGLISSSAMLEGPIQKGKSSFLVSGRRTYLDLLARPFFPSGQAVGYYFYDLNAKANFQLGDNDRIIVSGYFGRDEFFVRERTSSSEFRGGLDWGNATGTLRWNHVFNNQLFSNLSLIHTNYNFRIFFNQKDNIDETDFSVRFNSQISDWTLKYDVDYFPGGSHKIKTGAMTTRHVFTPNAFVVEGDFFDESLENVQQAIAWENAIYAEDDFKPFDRFFVNAGMRLSHFYQGGENYLRPEPRLSMAYQAAPGFSLKSSYAEMNQFVHLLSNTGIGLPTDLWVPSTNRIGPQRSRQVALGFGQDIKNGDYQLSVETYYKKSDDVIAYREGASFLALDNPETGQSVSWEDNVTTGQGWAYGMEFLLQKKFGRYTGWAGYTLSWTQLQFDEINFGEKFFARHDRRHDVSLVNIYELSPSITLSGTWVYGTGNAISLPEGTFFGGAHTGSNFQQFGFFPDFFRQYEYYGGRNQYRMAPYHRMDLSIQFHKQKKRGRRTWDLSIYNVYNRQNPFFYFFDNDVEPEGNTVTSRLRQVSLFPIIPSISYRYEF